MSVSLWPTCGSEGSPIKGLYSITQRFGISDSYAVSGKSITDYNYQALGHFGWYCDQEADYPNCPGNLSLNSNWTVKRLSVVAKSGISTKDTFPNRLLADHPSWFDDASVWQIGARLGFDGYHTPGRPGNYTAQEIQNYSNTYKTCYNQIKSANPDFKVMTGAIVLGDGGQQNLQFLANTFKTYYNTYHQPMPVDIFNVQIMIPDGTADPVQFIKTEITNFRQWMTQVPMTSSLKQNYRNSELWITALGINDRLKSEKQSIETMKKLIQWLSEPTKDKNYNSSLGLSRDENRLVQAWSWYALHDPNLLATTNIFDTPDSLSSLGQAYAQLIPQYNPEPATFLLLLPFLFRPRPFRL